MFLFCNNSVFNSKVYIVVGFTTSILEVLKMEEYESEVLNVTDHNGTLKVTLDARKCKLHDIKKGSIVRVLWKKLDSLD